MKKIITIIIGLFTVFSSIAQETKSELKTRFDVIRNETVAGANTKTRMANAYQELADASQSIYYVVASGTDTYTATLLNVDSYAGKWFVVQFTNANTGAATLNINGIGAIAIKKDISVALQAGDIPALSHHLLFYDGTNLQINLGGGGAAGDIDFTPAGSIAATNVQTAIQELDTEKSPVAGNASLITTGTLTTGSTGAGFTVALGTSTITGALPVANLTAKYILDSATPSTAGGTITLDMNSQIQRLHVGSASFASAKVIALSNTTNSLVFSFSFTVTNVAAVLTMPASFVMSTPDWNGTDWVPPSTGQYEMGGTYDGTVWIVKIVGPFN